MTRELSFLNQSSLLMEDANNYNDYTFQQIKPYLKGRVLEVGCGVGAITKRILPYVDNLVATGISRQALDYCNKKFNKETKIAFVQADIVSFNTANKFDVIICLNVLEHIKNDQVALVNMAALLKSSGVLILLVPFGQFMYSIADKESGHFLRYSKKILRQRVGQYFNIEKIYYFNFIGALGYFVMHKLLRKKICNTTDQISFFDHYLVGLTKIIDRFKIPFGLSLIAIAKKKNK